MIKPAQEEVRKKATDFLKAYENAQKKYQAALEEQRIKKSRRLKQQIELEIARSAFDDFQNSINAYYDQLVKIMYVYMDPETGEVILSPQDNTTELLEVNETYGSVQYHLKEIKKQFKFKQEDYDSTLLDATEQSVYARWNIAKKHTGLNRFLPILWKIGNTWEGAKVNNLGTIAEAYVNFYLAKYQFSNYLEQNVKTYILGDEYGRYGAASVDNMSGFLIGDTKLLSPMKRSIQFAVKKDTASPANMAEVYKETKKVIEAADFTEQLSKRFIDVEKGKAKQNQVKKLSESIEDTYEDLIQDLQKELKI